MGRNRFIQVDNVQRIELSEGDFIDVKKILSWGEQQDSFGDIIKSLPLGEGAAQLDPKRLNIGKALTYIVAWSFCDAHGVPQPVNESTLRNLDADTGREITDALNAHEAQMTRARAEKKTIPTGAPALTAT